MVDGVRCAKPNGTWMMLLSYVKSWDSPELSLHLKGYISDMKMVSLGYQMLAVDLKDGRVM